MKLEEMWYVLFAIACLVIGVVSYMMQEGLMFYLSLFFACFSLVEFKRNRKERRA